MLWEKLLGTTALDSDNNPVLVVGWDIKGQYILGIDSKGDGGNYDIDDLTFPELIGQVNANVRVFKKENTMVKEDKNCWFK